MPGNLLAGEYMVPCPTAMPESVFALAAPGHGSQHHHKHHHHGHHDHHESPDAQDLLGAERQCPVGLVLNLLFTTTSALEPLAEQRHVEVYGVMRASSAAAAFIRPYRSRAPPPIS